MDGRVASEVEMVSNVEVSETLEQRKISFIIKQLRKSRFIAVGVSIVLTCLLLSGLIEVYIRVCLPGSSGSSSTSHAKFIDLTGNNGLNILENVNRIDPSGGISSSDRSNNTLESSSTSPPNSLRVRSNLLGNSLTDIHESKANQLDDEISYYDNFDGDADDELEDSDTDQSDQEQSHDEDWVPNNDALDGSDHVLIRFHPKTVIRVNSDTFKGLPSKSISDLVNYSIPFQFVPVSDDDDDDESNLKNYRSVVKALIEKASKSIIYEIFGFKTLFDVIFDDESSQGDLNSFVSDWNSQISATIRGKTFHSALTKAYTNAPIVLPPQDDTIVNKLPLISASINGSPTSLKAKLRILVSVIKTLEKNDHIESFIKLPVLKTSTIRLAFLIHYYNELAWEIGKDDDAGFVGENPLKGHFLLE